MSDSTATAAAQPAATAMGQQEAPMVTMLPPNQRDAVVLQFKQRGMVLNPVQLARDTAEAVVHHWRAGTFNWPMIVYIGLVHIAAVIGLLTVPRIMWQTKLWAFVLWPITGLGITGGVHRLWAHRSYEAHWSVRVLLMLIQSCANQGSIYHWSRDHRVHHKHSETDGDPHNAQRGFFFAHVGWLLVKKHPRVIAAGRTLDFSDLDADPVVRFQSALDPWFALFMCFAFPALVATFGWGEDVWAAFWTAGALRYCWVLHCTWLVNSAAHMYGDHPYDNSWPAENPVVSVLAVGEGWHNWHHKYPYDYAASEFGASAQFNPTKMFIDACAALGLVWRRKRATGAWERVKERRDAEEQRPQLLSTSPPAAAQQKEHSNTDNAPTDLSEAGSAPPSPPQQLAKKRQ